jgi:hypothetical protein
MRCATLDALPSKEWLLSAYDALCRHPHMRAEERRAFRALDDIVCARNPLLARDLGRACHVDQRQRVGSALDCCRGDRADPDYAFVPATFRHRLPSDIVDAVYRTAEGLGILPIHHCRDTDIRDIYPCTSKMLAKPSIALPLRVRCVGIHLTLTLVHSAQDETMNLLQYHIYRNAIDLAPSPDRLFDDGWMRRDKLCRTLRTASQAMVVAVAAAAVEHGLLRDISRIDVLFDRAHRMWVEMHDAARCETLSDGQRGSAAPDYSLPECSVDRRIDRSDDEEVLSRAMVYADRWLHLWHVKRCARKISL